ncbi:hypothetical protein D3C80_2191160 [compost metagenome]
MQGARQFFTDFQRRGQYAFVAATENCQGAVRRHALEKLIVFEVVAELGAFLFLAGHQASTEYRFMLEETAQLVE